MRKIRIKLNSLLIMLVCISGISALVLSAAFALYTTNQDSRAHAEHIAQTVQQQLAWQMLKVDNNLATIDRFPDFYLWKNSNSFSGLCVTFEGKDHVIKRSLCSGDITEESWPKSFENLYLWLFEPGKEIQFEVKSKNGLEGWIKISPSVIVILHKAWQSIVSLMTFSTIAIIIMCTLLYLSLHWVLKPVRKTQHTLKQMSSGDLTVKEPNFHIKEWQDTAIAINTLALNLNKTIDERKQLSLKLLDVQESERRYLCRELHDELGQALTGLRALTFYIEEEIEERCPDLTPKVQQISTVSDHMMELVKALLFRLRPADLDELGVAENLKSMINEWETKHESISCKLTLKGDIDDIPTPIAVNLLRTVQECLTNIVKHASATSAEVQLQYHSQSHKLIKLCIQDNGKMTVSEPFISPGNGILGIQERIAALSGELSLSQSPLGGLNVKAVIPVLQRKEPNESN
jgi:signal transduction histidine kinase